MLKTVKHRRYSLKLDSYQYLYAVLSVVLPGNKLVHFAFHDTSSQCEVFQDFFWREENYSTNYLSFLIKLYCKKKTP